MREDVAQELYGVLFALVVSQNAYPNFAFMPEITVVAHFSGEENVGSGFNGFVDEKVSGTAAQGDAFDGTLRPIVVHQAFNTEYFFHLFKEVHRLAFLWQVADDSASALSVWQRLQKLCVLQVELLCNAEIHACGGIVEVGVGGIDGNVFLDGTCLLYTSDAADE